MFNAKKTADEIIDFIKDYYNKNNLKGAVIGISGGKDSGVVAGLFAKALGSDNVLGVWMPCHSKDLDKANAKLVADTFGFKLITVDLTDIYDDYVNNIKKIYNNELTDIFLKDANINIKPRLRTATLYYQAALNTKLNNGVYLVAGTSNKCEIYVGYFTKGGDNVADIQVLADLTVEQVIAVGEVIGVPDAVVHKAPDDGLSGLTDEDKLGVKYNEIAEVIRRKESDNTINPIEIDNTTEQKVLKLHNNNMHKFYTPTYKKDNK